MRIFNYPATTQNIYALLFVIHGQQNQMLLQIFVNARLAL
jgi:hypothetical protein